MRYSNRIVLTCPGLLFLLVVAAKADDVRKDDSEHQYPPLSKELKPTEQADKTQRIYENASKLLEAAIARNGGKKKSAMHPEH